MANIGVAASGARAGGTVVAMPPPPPRPTTIAATESNVTAPTSNAAPAPAPEPAAAAAARDVVGANVARRNAGRDRRKRELLAEAREARIAWVLDGGANREGDGGGDDGNKHRLGELRACAADVLPCSPLVAQAMVSRTDAVLERLLAEEGLPWEAVSGPSRARGEDEKEGEASSTGMAAEHPSLALPELPSPEYYPAFLDALCEPSAAGLVMSMQKFCKTIEEAAGVMVATLKEDESDGVDGGEEIDHGASLAKAIRGFVKTTLREMEGHDAFRGLWHPDKGGTVGPAPETAGKDGKPAMDAAAREQLQASLERFVYGKCRGDVDAVLLAGKDALDNSNSDDGGEDAKTLEEAQRELHDKMLSLQFVAPAHLEISCLKSHSDLHHDIDLSYSIFRLQSIEHQSSPRQMLRSILLAHRGVSMALNDACADDDDPPGADDVLPALILAVLRAHPPGLPAALRFVETFAPPPLLRGEAGYAYTNLCGAVQFIRELDVEGHLAEVTLGGMGEGAVLHIGPEEFRAGLEGCRRRMKEAAAAMEGDLPAGESEEDGYREGAMEFAGIGYADDEAPVRIKITARQVREARSRGETVDLAWATKKQNEFLWREGRVKDMVATPYPETEVTTTTRGRPQGHRVPPEDPPAQFSRSYPFLATRPEDIGVRDLPRLLKEYRRLVRAAEGLLEERAAWREDERRRMLRLERQTLERDFADAMGDEEGDRAGLANGH